MKALNDNDKYTLVIIRLVNQYVNSYLRNVKYYSRDKLINNLATFHWFVIIDKY